MTRRHALDCRAGNDAPSVSVGPSVGARPLELEWARGWENDTHWVQPGT
jgi:hypothetical protein